MPELRHRIRISAPLDPVWSALTTAQGLQAWWAPDVEVDDVGGHVSVKAGSANFVWSAKNNGESGIVEWTCLEGPGSSPGSVVTFAVAADDDDHTVVTLVHEGWTEDDPNIEACNTRWGGTSACAEERLGAESARARLPLTEPPKEHSLCLSSLCPSSSMPWKPLACWFASRMKNVSTSFPK
ncbi:SRPBCC domain-containing protein [Microbacterium sp. Bi128]|uniref:SRPBCC family protein n=1 Tax=Microbacterium sp. Bi128 TaxID=2821115 RepID=UPI001E0E36BF|nr:SRPBCC domain-containing protein [Microbacterium sp. Bi128]CAH0164726.1 hypothetical protein SRABI128_00879 [Microbacterium sp. Bi128]